MIKNFEELGDVLSEIENRLSLLENSMPNVQMETKSVLLEPKWGASQWDVLNQLKSEVTGWRQKHAEMMLELDKLKKQPKDAPF